jgi:hypothetical protein
MVDLAGGLTAIARDTTFQQGVMKDKLMSSGTTPSEGAQTELNLEQAKVQQAVNNQMKQQSRDQFLEKDERRRREIQSGILYG